MRNHHTRSFLNSLGTLLTVLLVLSTQAKTTGAQQAPANAIYNITFEATWSAETHPLDFPSNPHFSGLIGGNHNDQVSFWQVGELASLGIQRMAEWGSQSPLDDEVEAAIVAGHAEAVIRGGGIGVSPGSVSETFSVSQEFPLVTLVTMIAPSPDWFVGVSGVSLFEAGAWVEELVLELLPYDAGTDSGPSYASPDQPTMPPEPIYLKTDGPFAGGVPLGTFTFTLISSPTTVPAVDRFSVRNFPNPFNPRTTIAYEVPVDGPLSIAIFDLKGHLVRRLLDRVVTAGGGSLTWDGTDQSGRPSAAGLYVLQVEAGDRVKTRKLALVR